MRDITEEFKSKMSSVGILPPEYIVADGELHYFSVNGKPSNKDGRYVLHDDPVRSFGWFKDWKNDIEGTWQEDKAMKLTQKEELAWLHRKDEMHHCRQEEEQKRNADACIKAEKIWNKATKASDDHHYLKRKKVHSYGIKTHLGVLVIPARVKGKLTSLQLISSDGNKKFMAGGEIRGAYFSIGIPSEVLCVSEGYATGATIHEATGYAVAIAFSAGNLKQVAQYLRSKFPKLKLILCADSDIATKGNPGLTNATEAAIAVGGLLAVPDFGDFQPLGMSDFNDLASHRSLQEVKQCIENAIVPRLVEDSIKHDALKEESVFDDNNWHEPLPLITTTDELMSYPIEALPEGIRNAVQEVVAFQKSPVPIAACSALSALSLAGQGLADVSRRYGEIIGPISLFFLVIAESGERKSSCDKYFTDTIREWESQERILMKPEVDKYTVELKAKCAEIDGVKSEIKRLSGKGEPTNKKKEKLTELELTKPKKPIIPRLLYTDVTPEALALSLSHGWPSGGILSSEAGNVLGSHSMRHESAMSNLALLNTLWDGGSFQVDRKQAGSFYLQGARLTMGLAVQPKTIRLFFQELKGLARDIGFTSRFLVAYPKSTMGTRFIEKPHDKFVHLPIFQKRIDELLKIRPTFCERGGLVLHELQLSSEANDAWISFYNLVEGELVRGGDLVEIRDSASKAAENASRLAALFHLYDVGLTGLISKMHMENASKIVAYHLYEKKRFDNEIDMPENFVNASLLESWLINKSKEGKLTVIDANEVLHSGPSRLRRKKDRDDALEILEERHRLRRIKNGKRYLIELNPILIENDNEVA